MSILRGIKTKEDSPPQGDPWYRDTRREETARGPSWLTGRPRDWMNAQPGFRRSGGRRVSAELIRQDGQSRSLPAPNYDPTPFVPGEQ